MWVALTGPRGDGFRLSTLPTPGPARTAAGLTPDSARFRHFPVFPRSGIPVESPLGHCVVAGQGLYGL